jgi:hypothetical protein
MSAYQVVAWSFCSKLLTYPLWAAVSRRGGFPVGTFMYWTEERRVSAIIGLFSYLPSMLCNHSCTLIPYLIRWPGPKVDAYRRYSVWKISVGLASTVSSAAEEWVWIVDILVTRKQQLMTLHWTSRFHIYHCIIISRSGLARCLVGEGRCSSLLL